MTWFIAIWAAGLALRILPVLVSRRLGSDQWYWLLYVETLKRDRRFPIDLPYVLEVGQWYPPAFPLMLSILPIDWTRRYGRIIPPLVDSLQLALVGYVAAYLADEVSVGLAATAVYALTPLAVTYNYQLNPRGIGALALSIQFVSLFLWIDGGDLFWLGVVTASGVFICLLHKMTTQMMVIGLVSMAAWTGSVAVAALVPAIGIAAFALSGGFYRKVLRAHYDIVSFWSRNRDFLNAHQYDASDLYRRVSENPALLHVPGFKGVAKHLRSFVVANPHILVLPFLVATTPRTSWTAYCFLWVAMVYGWGLATALIPQLRCLGAGVYYTYNAALPLAVLAGISAHHSPIAAGALVLTGLVSLVSIVHGAARSRSSTRESDADLVDLCDHLRSLPDGNVFCIPFTLSEVTVYRTRKPVAWGGHGYGLKLVEPYFPVMRVPLEEALESCNVRYVLHDTSYVDLGRILADSDSLSPIAERGRFTLYTRKPAEQLQKLKAREAAGVA